jgi:hypothetical protein
MRTVILFLLLLPALALATILRVPQDHPGVQAAMDASATGDTVLVERGTWTGLLQRPVHDLLLCSNHLFTGDTTDIVETVLDGEYAGTILTVNTAGDSVLTVQGFTMWRGQGQASELCGHGGAVHMEEENSARFTDIVFADCRSPWRGAVLYKAYDCFGMSAKGDLMLRRIHIQGTVVDHPEPLAAIHVAARSSRLVIDGFTYDGSGQEDAVAYVYTTRMDTVLLKDVRVFNCDGSSFTLLSSSRRSDSQVVRDVEMKGCALLLQFSHFDVDSSIAEVRNIELTASPFSAAGDLFIGPQTTRVLMDSISIHGLTNSDPAPILGFYPTDGSDGNVLRNLDFHHNQTGDSSVVGQQSIDPMIYLQKCDLIGASIHDNTVIIPGDPSVSETGGNYAMHGAFLKVQYGSPRLEDLHFADNLVVDLDDYSVPAPGNTPKSNRGRELSVIDVDSLTLRNVTVRRSRQPNACPELRDTFGFLSEPGSTVYLDAEHVAVEDLLLEDCDDGGLQVYTWGGRLDRVVLRDVGRSGLRVACRDDTLRVRNLLVENVVAEGLMLSPEDVDLSRQAAVVVQHAWPSQTWIEVENATVRGCAVPNLLQSSISSNVHVTLRNVLIGENDVGQLVVGEGSRDWSHCLVPDPVPGEGNLIGVDPLFDAELGPPFLSPLSPCVDAGDPDPAYDDVEDPANPGFALWPSQGGLRGDIGFTGGPGASGLELGWVPVLERPRQTRPAVPTLGAPWPNPFNPTARIEYELPRPSAVLLTVHDLLGRRVALLAEGPRAAGRHEAVIDGSGWASGLYFVTLEAAGRVETRKVLLVR